MHFTRAILTTAALGLTLSACAVTRPPSRACPALPLVQPALTTVSTQSSSNVAEAANSMAIAIEAQATEIVADTMRAQARAPRAAPKTPITLRIITLSAGGQFGAFGAGFLEGWSQQPGGRPQFDVVTGVSAGAILAPVAFAGSDFDPILRFYRGLDADSVSTARPILSLPSASSLRSAAPLKDFLLGALSPALLSAVSKRHAAGDRLLISAVNIDSTAGEIFDLGATASAPNGADCMAEAMLASAAIPGVLPPRHINGALYADGGLREQVFFRAVDTARTRVARETGRPVRVEAYLIVNGSVRPPDTPAEDRLLGYIGRAVEILADEVLRDSITDALTFAEGRPGWRLRGILATTDFPDCDFENLPTGTFDACITRTLYDSGVAAGAAKPINWLSASELRALATEL